MSYVLEALMATTYTLIDKPQRLEGLREVARLSSYFRFDEKPNHQATVHLPTGEELLEYGFAYGSTVADALVVSQQTGGMATEIKIPVNTVFTVIWNTDTPLNRTVTWVPIYKERRQNYVNTRALKLSHADDDTIFRMYDDYYRDRTYTYYQGGRIVTAPTDEQIEDFCQPRYKVMALGEISPNSTVIAEGVGGWSAIKRDYSNEQLVGINSLTTGDIAFEALGSKWRYIGESYKYAGSFGVVTLMEGTPVRLYFDRKLVSVERLYEYVNAVMGRKQVEAGWLSQQGVYDLSVLCSDTLKRPSTDKVRDHLIELMADINILIEHLPDNNAGKREHALLSGLLSIIQSGVDLYD